MCRNSFFLQYILDGEHNAAPGSLASSKRSAKFDRLACNNSVNAVAFEHAVGVHHPSHNSSVRSYIRSRNILFRSDQRRDSGRESSGDRANLIFREFAGIADNTALSAAIRDIDDRALERHPCCQSPYFILIDIRMEADSSFGRSAGSGMLDTVAFEYLRASIIHTHRNRDLQFSFRVFQCFNVTV